MKFFTKSFYKLFSLYNDFIKNFKYLDNLQRIYSY